MILYLKYPNDEQQHFKVMELEDLSPIFEMFPRTHDIALACDTLKDALESIAEYLSGNHMSAWVEDQDLSKSIKSKALALGLTMTTALGSGSTLNQPRSEFKPSLHPTAVAAKSNEIPFGKHPMDRFLWNVQQIESSGGKNTKHKPIQGGQFKGTKAIGKWGLLKPTVQDIISRMRIGKTLTPEYQKLEPMSRDQLENHFQKHPEVELHLARKLAEHVLKRQKNNPHSAAFAWNNGHNLFPQRIDSATLTNSDYVSKYKNADKMNPYKPKAVASKMQKMQPNIDSADFKHKVQTWYKRRENELTDEPTRTSNYQPDPGRMRDNELDTIKPDSQKTPKEKLQQRIKESNENRK